MSKLNLDKSVKASSDHIEIVCITENLFGAEFAKIICNFRVRNEPGYTVHTAMFDIDGENSMSSWQLINEPEHTLERFAEQEMTIKGLREQNRELTRMLNHKVVFDPDLLEEMSDLIERFKEELGK